MKTPRTTLLLVSFLLTAGALSAKSVIAPRPLIRCTAELDRGVLPADERQTAVVKVSLVADAPPRDAERPPINLCIVLDKSGSMSGSKIEHARESALEALSRLGEGDVFSLITYDSEVKTLIAAQRITNLAEARATIRSIRSGGNTALFGGVSQGAAELRKFVDDHPKGMVHRMILLSDGLANVGPSSPEDLGRLGTSLMKEGISVTTVGIGNNYNEDLMTSLAQRSDGNTYFVENSRDLARIFNEELGDVLSVVARNVRVIIECPQNVKPLRTIGREATIRGQQVELNLNQLYGNQERFLLLEVEVPPTPAELELPLVHAVIHYNNVFTRKPEQQTASLNAQFSKQKEEVQKSSNPDVVQDYLLNESAEVKEQAIRQWEEGDQAGAKESLREINTRLNEASYKYDLPSASLPELTQEAQNVDRQVKDLEREGLNRRNRKILRTEALQEKNQQRVKRHR